MPLFTICITDERHDYIVDKKFLKYKIALKNKEDLDENSNDNHK